MKITIYLLLLTTCFGCYTEQGNNIQEIKIPTKIKIENKKTNIKFETQKKIIEYHQNEKDTIIEFPFKNTGKYPLLINKALSSCGCTVTNYPKEFILPSQKSKIQARISLNSNNKDTLVKQTSIRIYGNFNDSIINLSIISKVIPNKK